MDPSLSPDGERIIYTTIESSGKSVLWMSSVSGGAPIPVSSNAVMPLGGDWSPDGSHFVVEEFSGSRRKLAVVSTSGNAPVTEIADLGSAFTGMLPTWLPTGDWIAYSDASGWHLISPDGKQHKSLGDIGAVNLGFTKDGKTAYGLRTDGITWSLFSLDVNSAKVTDLKQISDDAAPMSRNNPGTRFSIAPDGKSFAYSTGRSTSSLWLLQGWQQ
jgi:Tol biopolymer transport system component